ncbi:helix-turn-helix domain-containing protein [Microbacterium sp. NEAU-LLC]|uniref:Helix-turn-helix domain-containing protein n=2 Tax=Microbacterium helvum TaxID=2773713 RepID=A0ABR8NQQ0_9MICO|nr:helix-turn-helix domain-containing protein [Microbacterium helvum]
MPDEGTPAGAVPEDGSTTVKDWVAAYVVTAREAEHVQEFVTFVDERISGGIPEIHRDPALMEDLHQSTRSQWIGFLGGLSGDGYTFTLTPQAIALAQSIVRRGLDLTVLLNVYRIASQALWDFFTRFVAGLGPGDPPRDEVLVHLYGLSSAWVEEMTERLIEVFYAERGQFFDGAAARRRELIDAILAGDPVEREAAGRVLGHQIERTQLCVIFWVTEATAHTLPTLREAARSVAEQLGAPPPLTVVAGSREVWCWIALPNGHDAVPATALDVPAAINAAVGSPVPGVDGFRIGYEQARAVQALVESAGGDHPFTRYEDVDVLCLVGGRTDAADRVVRRTLGDLAGGGPSRRVLRESVQVYLQHGMSVDATAAALVVHRNTVRYRLERAERHLPAPIADHIFPLAFALQYVAWFDVAAPERRHRPES